MDDTTNPFDIIRHDANADKDPPDINDKAIDNQETRVLNHLKDYQTDKINQLRVKIDKLEQSNKDLRFFNKLLILYTVSLVVFYVGFQIWKSLI